MPSGDPYGVKNLTRNSVDLGVRPESPDNESPDNKAGVPTNRFGHIDAPIRNSNDHIDLLIDQVGDDSISTNSGSTLTESVGSTSTGGNETSTEIVYTSESDDGTLTDYDDTGLVFVKSDSNDSLPIRLKSDDSKPEQPQPLKNRRVKVRTGTGAFLGAIGGIASLGIAAASSGAVIAKLALIGAGVGTLVPGVGTVIGAVVGAAIGAIAVGGAGAAIGALLVKAGGWTRRQFKGPEVDPPQLPRPQDITNREELDQALKQIKETYAFDAPWFKQIAWHTNVSRRVLKPHRAKINQAFGAIVDKFAERTRFQKGTGKVESAQLPSENFLNAALGGLMAIYGAPSEFNVDVDTQNGRQPYKDQIAERFAAFIERNPDADPETVLTVATAYIEFFDPEYLGPYGRSTAFDEFDRALSERMAFQDGDEREPPNQIEIWSMADSAAKAAHFYNSILLPNGAQANEANITLPVDLTLNRVAKTWMELACPLIDRGSEIDDALARAVQGALDNLYRKTDIRPGTVEKFEEFLMGRISRTGNVHEWTARSVEDGLSKLDRNWTSTGEGLDAAQDAFLRWADVHIGNQRIVSTRMVDTYLLENYGINQPGID